MEFAGIKQDSDFKIKTKPTFMVLFSLNCFLNVFNK